MEEGRLLELRLEATRLGLEQGERLLIGAMVLAAISLLAAFAVVKRELAAAAVRNGNSSSGDAP